MIDINDIKIEDLQDETRFGDYQAAIVEAIETGRARDALELRIRLQQFFQEYRDLEITKPQLFKNYRKIILYIELELFELLTEDLQVVLLQRYFNSFAQLNLDVARKVDQAILLENELLQDDKRDTFTAAILGNQQMIGSERIELNGNLVVPTIANWAQKYRVKYGLKHQDDIVRMDFCERDEARTLSEEDKTKLRTLIDVVEELKVEPQPEQEESEEGSEDYQQSESKRVFSPLYVPTKKPKVPLSQVSAYGTEKPATTQSNNALRSRAAQGVKAASQQQNTQQPAQPNFAAQQAQPVQFRSLADLSRVDLAFVQNLGTQFGSFANIIKSEVQKVYGRSPESRPHIVELWRTSPLYHLYKEMSEESVMQHQPITTISETRQASGKPTLTKEQFDIVADLSKTIQ